MAHVTNRISTVTVCGFRNSVIKAVGFHLAVSGVAGRGWVAVLCPAGAQIMLGRGPRGEGLSPLSAALGGRLCVGPPAPAKPSDQATPAGPGVGWILVRDPEPEPGSQTASEFRTCRNDGGKRQVHVAASSHLVRGRFVTLSNS